MSRSLLIAAVAVASLGLALAFLAPTGNMGAQEAFYARLLLLIPTLLCGLLLFGFSAVVGAIQRLEQQGELLRLLLATRSDTTNARAPFPIPIETPDISHTTTSKDMNTEAPGPSSVISRAMQRIKPQAKAPRSEAMTERVPPTSLPPLRPMAGPTQPERSDEARLAELDTSFLERALREPSPAEPQLEMEPSQHSFPIAVAPLGIRNEEETNLETPVAAALNGRQAPASAIETAQRLAEPMTAPPFTAPVPELASEPSTRLVMSRPDESAPMAPAATPEPGIAAPREGAQTSKAPTIAELLERDLVSWNALAEKPKPRIVREGQFAGRTYRTFDDGSLEIDTEESTLRFDSLDEFRNFVSQSGQ